jgi:hypothetical protein
LPTARSATATAVLDGRIYVAGGEVPMLFAIHEVFDAATSTWLEGPAMQVPRHGVAAVALDDRIFVAGGGTVQGLQPTAHADMFVPVGPG